MPPLVFTVINEVVGMRFAIWSLCALYAVGIPQGLRIDLAKAEADVEASLAKRHYYRAEAPEKLAAATLSPAL